MAAAARTLLREADDVLMRRPSLGVLRLLEQGLSQREIARELFLSFHTVHSHAKSIYTRLDASSREEAIERARDLELL